MWHQINTQQDIEELINKYGGFHDSCMVSAEYYSGAGVNNDNSMTFGSSEDRVLKIAFQSQWNPNTIELCFVGVRRFNLIGWQDNYLCDIFDCYMAFHNNLVSGQDIRLIVWADSCGFNPKEIPENKTLNEPMSSFVVAEKLKWRFLEEYKKEEI